MDTTPPNERPSDAGADGPLPPVKAAPGPPRRVAAASVTMILMGIAVIVIGLGLVLAAVYEDATTGLACRNVECANDFMAPLGYVLLTAGIVGIVAAVQVKSGKAWAWLVAVVLGLVGAPFGLFVSLNTGDREITIGLVFLVPTLFVVFALVTSRHWFRSAEGLK